jgi:hypothetical protein
MGFLTKQNELKHVNTSSNNAMGVIVADDLKDLTVIAADDLKDLTVIAADDLKDLTVIVADGLKDLTVIAADDLKDLTVIAADDLKDLTVIVADGRHLQTGKNRSQNVISRRPNAYLRQIKRRQRKLFMMKEHSERCSS